MRPQLTIVETESGAPMAWVPERAVWDLVEYLSYQRARVRYSYEGDHFTVCFLQMDRATAQRLLNEWSAAEHLESVL